ncbi:MAG: DUF4199 domain-containing protein [Bacteroidales bacterium]|jgi:hypothetical protein|nr:DUF4199 domain-containing protein [Bacteroidales bacterium]
MIPFEKPVKYGLVAGLILIVLMVILYVADISMFNPMVGFLVGIINFAVPIVLSVLAVNKMRDEDLGRKVTYLQSFIAGFAVLLIAMYLSNIYSYIQNGVIDPEYMAQKADDFILTMEGKVPEETLDAIIDNLAESLNASKSFVKNLWLSPVIALALSAIISIFIKKNKTIEQIG